MLVMDGMVNEVGTEVGLRSQVFKNIIVLWKEVGSP